MSDATITPTRVKLSWIIGILAALAIFAVIGTYSSLMTRNYTDFYQEQAAARMVTLEKLQADAKATLTTADWIDQSKGVIRIPIEEAMAKEMDTLKNQPVAIGCEIPSLIPPPPAPAPAATPVAIPSVPAPAPVTPPTK